MMFYSDREIKALSLIKPITTTCFDALGVAVVVSVIHKNRLRPLLCIVLHPYIVVYLN